jgi:hypothetical protein
MKTRMTHAARAELVDAVRSRYSAASGKAKRRILDEFIAAPGYHEKSAIRVLSEPRAAKERQKRIRPSPYDESLEVPTPKTEIVVAKMPAKLQNKPQPVYAAPGSARIQALRMAWPIVARRLEGMPNISAMQLFHELCIQTTGKEMLECLEEDPDQIAVELLVEFQVRYQSTRSRSIHRTTSHRRWPCRAWCTSATIGKRWPTAIIATTRPATAISC